MEKGLEKGVEKGEHNRNVAITKSLLDQGMEPAWVASITGLPLAEVEALAVKPPKQDG